MLGGATVSAAVVAVVLGGCASAPKPALQAPAIPTILTSTTVVRTPVMVDRDLPEDCELIVPVEVVGKHLGRAVPGQVTTIIGVPEPSIARTAKVDCYYDVGENQSFTAAPLIVGLAKYGDEASARERVSAGVEAEKQEGATAAEVDVGRQKGVLISTAGERLLVGVLGKTTFVARAKVGYAPDDRMTAFLTALAVQSMTPVEGS
ncbi:hypothetical protein [Saccharothrix obliqua]|uniref:hypothetical protein n=1 Tax=Saccharothrix obliqua TaxID=2861747 RepID=UPI001C5F1831|nr:hypothetical protein [Saccharothrix obliqua]MBW4719918.1 hypothetical protein [Saccharothrix obliqua]